MNDRVSPTLVAPFDALPDHIALLSADGEIVGVNRAWSDYAKANGYEGGGTGLGANYLEICERAVRDHADEAGDVAKGIRAVLEGKCDSFELEYPCNAPNEERWFELSVRPVAGPSPIAAIMAHRDRSEVHRAWQVERDAHSRVAAALAASQADRATLEATLQALPVGVWIADVNGALTHTNAAGLQLWGGDAPLVSSPEEYGVYQAFHAGTQRPVEPDEWPLARTIRDGQPVADELFEIVRGDGTRAHCIWTSAPIRDSSGVMTGAVVVGVDVTARQLVTRELERVMRSLELERGRLVVIFDEAPTFLAVCRGEHFVFERVNPAFLELVGPRQLLGKQAMEALPELVNQGFLEIMQNVLHTGVSFSGRQLPVRLARDGDGPLETRYVNFVYQRLEDGDTDDALVAHGVDVTDQVLATAALRQSELRLREQFAKLPVPTFLWEARTDDFELLDLNEAAKRMNPGLGDNPIGRMGRELYPGFEEIHALFRRCLRENILCRHLLEVDTGTEEGVRLLDLTLGPQQPDRVLVHVNDVTDRRHLEAQLRQAQKMEAVGRLAGGVAHDFNNLLTVIGAHSSFLLEGLDASNPAREDAEAIQMASVRAAGLTRQLLAFSRKQILRPEVVDVNAIVAETVTLLERVLTEDIAVKTRLADDLQPTVADAGQLGQVLMNLALNARDAMPTGGTLTMVTCKAVVTLGSPLSTVVPPGVYTQIEVRDTGIGMDDTVKSRLFEPFFTTKEAGRGTGLGLATAYGIVKQSAGYIMVDSTVGVGTTFRVYFPSSTSGGHQEEARAAVAAAIHGVETVLLVEDERAVRLIAQRILRRHGYVVLEAANGAEALALSDEYPTPIHLVVCDVVMPGLGGAEVVRQLQERRPALKVLFLSGYTEDEVVRRGIVSHTVPFLEKPYDARSLARAVRDALDRPVE